MFRWAPFLVISLLFTSAACAQENTAPEQDYCAQVSDGLPHEDAFRAFCDWVISFDTKLPNIIGNQETRRYHTDNGRDRKLMDTTSARIAYVDGRPQFGDVEINHVKIGQEGETPEMLKMHGAWSTDDFGGALRLLFGSHTYTRFTFAGESSWEGAPVLVFGYEVARGENHRWELKATNRHNQLEEDFPGYMGRILLDAKTFTLVRFERQTTDVVNKFPLSFGGNQVSYKKLPLGDGTWFVLPVESVVTFCHDKKHHNCEVNDTRFENWRKFAARTRIITGSEPQ